MKIKPSSYIRNEYADLSSYCRETGEPVYLTKNGEGDIVALSIETYEQLQNRIKNLEAKLFLMREFKNAEEYNHLHQRTYTQQEAEDLLEVYLSEKETRG